MVKSFLLTFLLTFLTGCFSESSEDSGGGLFNNNQEVVNEFSLTAPNNQTLIEGQDLNLILTHPFDITVTGTPRIAVSLDSGTVYANYVSGSGTRNLYFRYTIVDGDDDSNGVEVASSVDLNGGNLTFSSSGVITNSETNYTSVNTSGLIVDSSEPSVTLITPPLPMTYLVNQAINFVAVFDETVNVTGTPRMELDIDGSTVYANYQFGSGSNSLTFTYNVQSSDVDLDGIAMGTTLDLNGGSIKDVNGNASGLTYTAIPMPTTYVNGDLPYVSSITPPASKTYYAGESIDLTLGFTEIVNVTGTPRVSVDINGSTKYLEYSSGSGSNSLVFSYIILPGDYDNNGINLGSMIDLNGGTIQDGDLNNSSLNAPNPLTPSVLVDAQIPQVVNIILPSNNTYVENDEIFFVAQFNTAVDITGAPIMDLLLDSSAPVDEASYISGSGTQNIVFKYTVKSGDLDLNGISIDANLDLNSGSISSTPGNINADLDISAVVSGLDMSGILMDAAPPQITFITPPADGSYITGQDLDFSVQFSKVVNVTGTPRISLTVGGSTLYANYESGDGSNTLLFRYTITGGDTDSDGIAFTSTNLDLNGGAISDATPMAADLDFSGVSPSLAAIMVNASAVFISSVTPIANGTYIESQNIDITITTSENVNVSGTPRIQLDIGGSTKYANYSSGTGTSSLVFSYSIETGLSDLDGIILTSPLDLNGGTIQNGGLQNLGLSFTLPDTSGILVDSIAPIISSVIPPSNNTYLDGQILTFTINTDEIVNVTGSPRLTLDIGGATRYADYQSGSGSTALVFDYTIEAGLSDGDGISLVPSIDLNGGSIQNAILQNLDLSFSSPNLSAVLVDGIVPTISSVTPPADGSYIETNSISFTLNIDQVVNVTGTPRLVLDINGTTKYADYVSGTGSNALVFTYTVEASLEDLNGITLNSPMELNGGTIQNASLRNLDLSLVSPNLSAVLVDSLAPTVAISSPIDNSIINAAADSATYAISGTCSETSQTVSIEIDSAAAAFQVGFSCDGSNFSGTIDTTGLSQGAHTLTAILADAAGNSTTSTVINLNKDLLNPTVSSVTAPLNGNYLNAANLDFIVNVDMNTDVTGTPRLVFNVGGTTRYANYLSGTGSTALTFRYITTNPDDDQDGISFSSTNIDLNGGTLLSSTSNPANLDLTALSALPNTSGIIVDTVIPTVAITSSPDITAANQNVYLISGTCSEEGRNVSLNIGSIALTPICSSLSWNSGIVNVSGEADSATFSITADLSDAAGNNATQSAVIVDKDTATPTVAIISSPNVDASNQTDYYLSGTCTENGVIVDVNITDSTPTTINVQPNCSSGTWNTGSLDVSSLAEESNISVTADHDTAIQASTTIDKDTVSPTVTISSSPNISLGNETSYIASGTCSENGVMVDINIDVLNFQPNCNSGSWTTGVIDVSSLADSASLSFTVDHSSAPQASTTVSKNTATPSISSLSVPTTLANSADLNWTLNDPGGFTINDYDVNYRIKGTPTWLGYADGVSTDVNATVSSLIAATTYEFRVRVQYDTSQYSDWSMTAEGETKPDDPLFSSPYAAMNVGGSTTTAVVAYYDNTVVTLNGTPIPDSPLSKGQKSIITTTQFDVIDADKPIYTAGRLGSGGDGNKANMVWSPTAWAGKSFSFNATRANPQNLYVYATENATITVKQGATVLDTIVLTAGNGGTLSWSAYGSYQVTSTGTIMAYHMSGSGSTRYDPKPIMPGYTEIIGFPSNSMRITTDKDSTNYNLIHSNSTVASGNMDKQDVVQVNPQGSPTTLYQSDSLVISADQKISGASFADSNGLCASPFLPTNLMKRRYIVNVNANYVAFASKQAGTIDVYNPTQTIGVDAPEATLTLTRSGVDPNAPFKARRGNTNEGYRFVSTVPVAGWYHPTTDTGAAANDETILYGTND